MDRVILKRNAVAEPTHPKPRRQCEPEAGASVRLVRDGALVRALEVTCPCGERITVELEYEPDVERRSR